MTARAATLPALRATSSARSYAWRAAPKAARVPVHLRFLELRHRRRARAEDRIRAAKDTGLTNLPPHDLDQNRIRGAIAALACELTAWAQMLAPRTRRGAGNRNGYGCGSSPSPRAWSARPAKPYCTYLATPPARLPQLVGARKPENGR
jgi:hypothetical protein